MAQKRTALPDSTKRKVAIFCESNPKVKQIDVARKFGISVNQVIYACEQYRTGKLGLKYKRVKKPADVVINSTPEELLQQQYHLALAEMDTHKQLPVETRVNLLDKIIGMKKTLQSMELQAHIRRVDAELIGIIIRKFKPSATDDEVIKIYHEAYTEFKSL